MLKGGVWGGRWCRGGAFSWGMPPSWTLMHAAQTQEKCFKEQSGARLTWTPLQLTCSSCQVDNFLSCSVSAGYGCMSPCRVWQYVTLQYARDVICCSQLVHYMTWSTWLELLRCFKQEMLCHCATVSATVTVVPCLSEPPCTGTMHACSYYIATKPSCGPEHDSTRSRRLDPCDAVLSQCAIAAPAPLVLAAVLCSRMQQ